MGRGTCHICERLTVLYTSCIRKCLITPRQLFETKVAATKKLSPKNTCKKGEVNTSPLRLVRQYRAIVCLFLVVAQLAAATVALAQTKEPPQGQSWTESAERAGAGGPDGQATQTQNTVPNPYIDAPGFVPISNNSSNVNVKGGSYNGGSTPGIQKNVNDILKQDNPYGQNESLPTTLVFQSAEQMRGNPQQDVNNVLNQSLGSINDTYRGMHQFFNDDIIGNLFSRIGQLIGKWMSEIIDGWIADTVQFLGAFLRVFVLNPNIAVNGLNGSPNDGISPYIRQGADVMYGIAIDLLLLLFILAIWKYWAEASWRGGGNLMGAVGRLIFTSGLMLAFPTLYAFEIQITNEMIKAIYFNSSDQVMMLDSALASAVRGGILAGVGGLASAFAPLLGGFGLGVIGGTVGEVFAFAGLVIFLVLGGILIAELIYILVLKAIQTALLTAQYMFAPVFLVFFACPDTENVCSGFIKSWIETSLWTFVWVGLLKILVIIMFSDYNPWGKILMAVGVLQMMIQVPTFLARAQISPMSDFISAGLVTGGLLKMFGWMGSTARNRMQQGLGYYLNDRIGQTGFAQNTQNAVGALPGQNGAQYDKLKSLKDKVNGTGPGTPGTPGAELKNPLNAEKKDPKAEAAEAAKRAQQAAALNAARAGATGTGVPPGKKPGDPAGGIDPSTLTGGPSVATPGGAAASGLPSLGSVPATSLSGAVPLIAGAAAVAGAGMAAAGAASSGLLGADGKPLAGTGAAAPKLTVAPKAITPEQQEKFKKLVGMGVPTATAAALAFGGGGAGLTATGGVDINDEGGGGGAVVPPAAMSDELKKISHLKNPTLGDLDASGLWMVAGARAPVGDIRALKLQVRQNQGGGKVWGTSRGGYSRIDMPEDATPAQVAGMMAIAGYANETQHDSAAGDAARSAAIQEGAHRPQGLLQGAAANLNSYFGKTWAQTGMGKAQFEQAKFGAAVRGSAAYVNGKSGNAYSDYLQSRYGAFDQDKMDTLTLISTDPEAAESAWNGGITQATDRLIASGTKITAANRGAALNPYVAGLRPAAAGSAIRAMVIHGLGDARMQGVDPNSGEGGMLLGEILRGTNPEKARAVHEMYLQTGGADLDDGPVAAVSGLSAQGGIPAGLAYKALSGGLNRVATSVSGNQAFSGARSFDQVHQVAVEQYGPEVGTQMYDTIFRVAHDRAQMGLQSAGRLIVDQDVSNMYDQSMENIGGWATLADPGNVTARDNAQTMASAVGMTVNKLGVHGATAERATGVFHYMADGNTQQLGAQDIVAVEKLHSMGAPRISQSMVQVMRSIDTNSNPGIDLGAIQQIASHVEMGNARPDQAVAVSKVMSSGVPVSRPMVEIAAIMDSGGNFNSDTFRVVANLYQGGTVGTASAAPTVFTHAVMKAASDANAGGANIDVNQGLNHVLSQLESTSGGRTTAGTIASTISDIKQRGGFEDRQLVNPVLFEAAYEAAGDPSVSSHRVQSIRIVETMHGAGAIQNQEMLQTYDTCLENGMSPNDLTQNYDGLQRYYAASALEYARNNPQQYPVSSGQSAPLPSRGMLDGIRRDPRFQMGQASASAPPRISSSHWGDLL